MAMAKRQWIAVALFLTGVGSLITLIWPHGDGWAGVVDAMKVLVYSLSGVAFGRYISLK